MSFAADFQRIFVTRIFKSKSILILSRKNVILPFVCYNEYSELCVFNINFHYVSLKAKTPAGFKRCYDRTI